MTSETLLLTGATGFLGRRLALGLAGSWRVIGASRTAAGPETASLDLADQDSIRRAFDRIRPAAVVHSGAIAGPDACEQDFASRAQLDGVRPTDSSHRKRRRSD